MLPSYTDHHYVRTSWCPCLLLINLSRHARAAGLLLRLPASQPEQATAGSAAAGRVGDQEAACELGPEATRGACGGLHAPGPWMRYAGCLRADLPPSKPCLITKARVEVFLLTS